MARKKKKASKRRKGYYVAGPFKKRPQAVAAGRGRKGKHVIYRWGRKNKNYYIVVK